MEVGKKTCRYLKELRIKFANLNNIDYMPSECYHVGDCKGTCPTCDAELAYLETCITEKQKKGEKIIYVE